MNMFSVMPVTDESDGKVEAEDDEHAFVEQARGAAKVLRALHVFLQGEDQRDAFEGVDGRPEEERHAGPRPEHGHAVDGRKALEGVVEDDADAEHEQGVAHQRHRCQPFQIADPVEEYQREGHDGHVDPRIQVHFRVMEHEL